MFGSMIGDASGSYIEVLEILEHIDKRKRSFEDRIKILDPSEPLFNDNSSYTDDSVLTCAIADSLLNNKNYEYYLRKYGNQEISLGVDKYGRSRFGKGFTKWLEENKIGDSIGNGAAMRISPVGFYFNNEKDIMENSRLATIPSHNSKEAIDAATSVALSIYLARNKKSKEYIKEYIEEKYEYNLNLDLLYLQHNNTFSSKAIVTVPQAIYCFLESNSFEDAIRKAISIGGDSDTIACITGSIAEAYYGIDDYLILEVLKYLPIYMVEVIDRFYNEIGMPKQIIKGRR